MRSICTERIFRFSIPSLLRHPVGLEFENLPGWRQKGNSLSFLRSSFQPDGPPAFDAQRIRFLIDVLDIRGGVHHASGPGAVE